MSIYDENTGGPYTDGEEPRTNSSWDDPRTYRPDPVSGSDPEAPALSPVSGSRPTSHRLPAPEPSFYPYAQEPAAAEPDREAPLSGSTSTPTASTGPSLGHTLAGAASSSTYTSAPATPAGYSFERAPYAASPAVPGLGSPTTSVSEAVEPARSRTAGRRRGPGWGALVGATVVAAVLASGGTAATSRYLSEPASSRPTVSASPSPQQSGTTRTVNSTAQAPDWQAVSAAVGNTVVAIAAALNDGTSQGSGVIYDAAGHIITNNHVVQGAKQIQVTLADGRIYDAKLTGTDPATDLAVIELVNPPKDLEVASVGDSDSLAIGQGVMAIGNPLGLSSTVTTGIVSALNRPVITTQEERSEGQAGPQDPGGLGGLLGGLPGSEGKPASQVVTNAIQVDAAINPGNSGGPLFDEHGKVIGINSSIATASKGSNGSIGIGFAIPAKLAKKVADQIIATGKATHAYLGVTLKDAAATADGVTRVGAEIQTVEPGSPAAKAGLRPQDVLTAIDGKPTSQAVALTGFVRQYSSGDQVTLTVIRDGKREEIQVTLAERADT